MIAFLFPGQGAERPQMLSFQGLCRATLDEAGQFLASNTQLPPLEEIDSADNLTKTVNAQLALLIEEVSAARALTTEWDAPTPDVVAGHSIGIFAAAVIAGALTFSEALQAVFVRGSQMETVCGPGKSNPLRSWGMAAVVGIDVRTAHELVEQVTLDSDPLWVANINSRRQIVFSGTDKALKALAAAAEYAEAQRVEQVSAAIASHCPLLQPVREALIQHLRTVPERPLTAEYLTNTHGRRARTSRDVLADLADSVVQPVQWRTIVELLPELNVKKAVEMAPGHVLTHLAPDSQELDSFAVGDIGFASAALKMKPPPYEAKRPNQLSQKRSQDTHHIATLT